MACRGNFFDIIPYEGRYDAQALALFNINKQNHVTWLPQSNLSEVEGQVRDIKWLGTGSNGKVLMIARNNDSLINLDY